MSWLERNWHYAGGVAAAILLILFPVWLRSTSLGLALVYLQLPLYMLHQIEEHHDDACV